MELIKTSLNVWPFAVVRLAAEGEGMKVGELVVLKARPRAGNFFIDVLAKQSPILRFDHEHLRLVINVWSPRATELCEWLTERGAVASEWLATSVILPNEELATLALLTWT